MKENQNLDATEDYKNLELGSKPYTIRDKYEKNNVIRQVFGGDYKNIPIGFFTKIYECMELYNNRVGMNRPKIKGKGIH